MGIPDSAEPTAREVAGQDWSAPSTTDVLDRARSLINGAMWTVDLQYRRLARAEPEDSSFVMRWWADLEFFLVALARLERSAQILLALPEVALQVEPILNSYKHMAPRFRMLRDVGEHIDIYAVDGPRRHHRAVSRRQLQVGVGGPGARVVQWRDETLDLDAALVAAQTLHAEATKAIDSACATTNDPVVTAAREARLASGLGTREQV